MAQTIQLNIEGKVQGVFFRKSTRDKAQELGITGTVENLSDGSVQIIATGAPEKLEQFTSWCNQGPSKAVVQNIKSTPLPLQSFDNFTVTR